VDRSLTEYQRALRPACPMVPMPGRHPFDFRPPDSSPAWWRSQRSSRRGPRRARLRRRRFRRREGTAVFAAADLPVLPPPADRSAQRTAPRWGPLTLCRTRVRPRRAGAPGGTAAGDPRVGCRLRPPLKSPAPQRLVDRRSARLPAATVGRMERCVVFRSGGTAPEARKSLTGRVAAPSATASRPS